MAKGMPKDIAALGAVLGAVEGLEPDEQRWVFASALSKLGLGSATIGQQSGPGGLSTSPGGHSPSGTSAPGSDDHGASVKDFYRAKNPQTDTQRVAVLAYYMSRHQGQISFKGPDLKALNLSAGGRTITNWINALDNATKRHILAPAGGGKKQITAYGEDVVDALPDQTAVGQVSSAPKGRKRGRKKAAKG